MPRRHPQPLRRQVHPRHTSPQPSQGLRQQAATTPHIQHLQPCQGLGRGRRCTTCCLLLLLLLEVVVVVVMFWGCCSW
jgi:hypothetical protein